MRTTLFPSSSVLLLWTAVIGLLVAQPSANPAWRTRIADASEAGEPLIVRGRFLQKAGGPAAAGVTIMVYHADRNGVYSAKQGRPIDVARLRAQFRTGPNGEYELVTVRPGPYPQANVPAHIHVNVVDPGSKEPHEICEFFFAGDPLLKGNERGYVLQVRKDAQGTWVATQDVPIR